MTTKTIEYRHEIGGVLTDVTSIVLRDPTNTFGIRRTDTDAVIAVSGTPLTRISTGVYRYTFNEPAANLTYEYWIERVYAGATKRTRQTMVTRDQSAGGSGVIPIAPNQYVTMGIETVSCGDSDLETFLNMHANLLWAMQARRGTALDLKYQYFVLELITLALDHVRMLIDTETATQQTQETGYSNSSNSSTAQSVSERTRTASSTQAASSSQTFTRTASRTSSSQMSLSATQTSTRAASGSDTSTQANTSKTTRTTSQHLETVNAPRSGTVALAEDYKLVDSRTLNVMEMQENVDRYSLQVLGVGQLSGQRGNLPGNVAKETNNTGVGNTSSIDYSARDSGSSYSDSGYTLSGKGRNSAGALTGGGGGTTTTDLTTIGSGARTNNVQRTSTSSMSGASLTTSSNTMSASSHDEAHRESASTFHAESLGHSETSANALAHREGQGASSMVSSSDLNRQYYNQIFESLKMMWDDTVAQIKKLEKEVQMTTRVIIQKLAVVTPQSTLAKPTSGIQDAGRRFLTGNPFGPFGNNRIQ